MFTEFKDLLYFLLIRRVIIAYNQKQTNQFHFYKGVMITFLASSVFWDNEENGLRDRQIVIWLMGYLKLSKYSL